MSVYRFLLPFLTLLFLVLPANAEMNYAREDRATVRVMAVRGVVQSRVEPPPGARSGKPITIGVAEAGHGSGVMLTADGIIATAQHVVDDAEFVAIKLPGEEGAVMAEVIYENKKHDVAFLKVPGQYKAFIGIPAKLPTLKVRKRVFALGYPLDGTREYPQSNAGVLAGALPNGELQLGLSANPGNSGGPLINEKGVLLGLVVRSADPRKGAQGIAIAVPISEVKKFYDRRVLGSERLAEARKNEKLAASSGAAAEVVARIAAISSIGTAIEHIEDTDKELRVALSDSRKTHKSNPDFLALLAAHYWNESVIRFSLDGRSWKKPLADSRKLARRAVKLDSDVLKRSPFLYSATGDSKKPAHEKTTQSAPRRVAGFRLGWTLDEARDACAIEDLEFKKTSSGYRCEEPPTVGSISGPVEIRLCDGKVCRVDVLDRPSRALSSLWVNQFKTTYKQFRSRYGKHDGEELHVPAKCKKNLLACLENGTARLVYRWSWNQRKLTLTLGRLDGKPTMRITLLDTPKKKKAKKSSTKTKAKPARKAKKPITRPKG